MPLLDQPSVQLYTVRDSLQEDVPGTLSRLASIGFRQVEPYSLMDFVNDLGTALIGNGLTAPSVHARLLDGQHKATFEAAAQLDIGTVIDPIIDKNRWTTHDDIARIADDLAKVAEDAEEFGVRVGYHNHAFELEQRIDDKYALEVFASHLPHNIVLEVDTYWVAVGGADPVALLERLGSRVRYLHIKDGPINKVNTEQVAVGSGKMPVADIIAATPALELGVVELDNHAGDVWDAVRDSYEFLTSGR